VSLIAPNGVTFVAHDRTGGSEDNLVITDLPVAAFDGVAAAGTWKLRVQDLSGGDVGTLNAWSVNVTQCN
jgi:subtilisin-like proprotein convertase family protein